MENVQIILNTESTLCLLYVSMLLFIIFYLFVFWSYISLYNCCNNSYFFICNYLKKYLITHVRKDI